MALELTLVDAAQPGAGTIRLPGEVMERLGVSAGDVVTVEGHRRTAARVGEQLEGPSGLAAAADVRDDARMEPGDRVTVAAATARPARAVTVAAPRGLRFEGETGAVASLLRGRAVMAGDAVEGSLFGGALSLTFTVTDVEPAEPGVVTGETSVRVAEAAGDARPRDGPRRAVSYRDVAGLDAELRRLRRLVEVPIERPAVYDRFGGSPPTGVLVYGPTGVGKTLAVTALGNEVDATFLHVTDPRTVRDRYEDGFASLAERARSAAPAVVFVENVDAASADDGGRNAALLAALRSFMDAVADDRVVVVGETTDPDAVDSSLRRGGRFDHELGLPTPGPDGRLAILRRLTADVPLADEVALGSLAERTHGYVGADLLALVREAVQHAIERLPDAVQFGDHAVPEEALAGADVTAGDFEGALEAVTPSGMREMRLQHPDVGYEDIGGAAEAKREVIRAVEWPLRYPDLFEHLASEAPTGVLLYGLPGTGKTMLARAVANATEANFIAVNGPELLDRYVGESERAVRDVFERARQHAPTVVFFDELDALAPTRGGDGDTDVAERVVSQLLTELDGIDPRAGVVVIGATNRPDMIDPALLRPGRFEKAVEVPIPDREARREIFKIHARDIPCDAVDFDALAGRTEGYTGSDIAAVVREAALLTMEAYLSDRSFEFDPETADLSGLRVGQDQFERAIGTVDRSVTERMREQYRRRTTELTG